MSKLPLKSLITIFIFVLGATLSIAYAASQPRSSEKFLSLTTLGSEGMVGLYYPNDNATMNVGDRAQWFLNVYNRMGEAELVAVRIKLLNATDVIPDDMNYLPSPVAHIYEAKKLLKSNETWVLPLSWGTNEVERRGGYYTLKGMKIGDAEVNGLEAKSKDGTFRIVSELWVYDPERKQFVYDWDSGADKRGVWNQIWFNVKFRK
jgi:hypothetical protein